MLEATVECVMVNPDSQQRVLVLKANEAGRYLPILVGPVEGDAIAVKLQGKELPRPMTHDLMDAMIGDLGAKVAEVVISELKEDTFMARIVLRRNGATFERDCRPSDAVALAVRDGATIKVEEEVLDRAGIDFDSEKGVSISASAARMARPTDAIISQLLEEAEGLLARARARARAERSGNNEIEPADLLPALLDEPDGIVAIMLADLGLDFAGARAKLEGRAEPGESASGERPG